MDDLESALKSLEVKMVGDGNSTDMLVRDSYNRSSVLKEQQKIRLNCRDAGTNSEVLNLLSEVPLIQI